MDLNLLDVECLLTYCKNAKAEFLDDEIMEKVRYGTYSICKNLQMIYLDIL